MAEHADRAAVHLLASVGLAHLITSVDWREARKGGALFLGISVTLFIVVAFVLGAFITGNMPDPTGRAPTSSAACAPCSSS